MSSKDSLREESTTESTVLPGRAGGVRGLAVSNARRSKSGGWGLRFGHASYPDYARRHPTRWDGSHGGMFLTVDEAEELAELLTHCAAWARAQEALR